jgi:hypothetical protein
MDVHTIAEGVLAGILADALRLASPRKFQSDLASSHRSRLS